MDWALGVKALAVDFRTPATPGRWAWGFLVVLMAAACGGVVDALILQRQLADRRAELASLQAQLAPIPQPAPVVWKPAYGASAREFLALATSPWPALLSAVESVEVRGVTPLSIEIAVVERSIRIELEISDFAQLLEYIDALNAGETSWRWTLVQSQMSSHAAAASAPSASRAMIRAVW